MDIPDFLDNLNKLSSELHEYLETQKNFRADLSSKLCNYACKQFPILNKNTIALNHIKKEADMSALMAFEYFIKTLDIKDSQFAQKTKSYLPKVKSQAESEIELQDFLKEIPLADHEYATKIHWEEYEYEKQSQQIKKTTHDIVKSVLVQHFEEDILLLNSERFRYLNNITWILAAEPFLEKVFECVD
ncbi:MAG: hypothetical protein JEZ09_17245 [Salinivirgaceae bacterium]|nr:hypothetical protein [Salinivirgaceae bacterium]